MPVNFCSALFSLNQNSFLAHQIPRVSIALWSHKKFWSLFDFCPETCTLNALCYSVLPDDSVSRCCFSSYKSYVLLYSGILHTDHCQYVLCKMCWLIKWKDFMLVKPNCLFNSRRCCNWDYHINHGHTNCFPGTSCNVSCSHKDLCRLLQALLHYPS